MFAARNHGRRFLSSLSLPKRKTPIAAPLETPNEVAKALRDTNIWRVGRSKEKGDRYRVHITEQKLADDVAKYMEPSLLRHQGCDLLDFFPGAGVWSKKLNDVLQPRTHILMEPEADIYKPFLKPLLDRPGVTLVPKSGVFWDELSKILTPEYLPHQVPRKPYRDSLMPLQRNDTLLVTANLSYFPTKRWNYFNNLTQMILYQFISAIRTSLLFHRYGMIRMLIWTQGEEKYTILPRTVQARRRFTFESELNTEWVVEVAGNHVAQATQFIRDRNIDLQGCQDVLEQMRRDGIVIPPGRESDLVRELETLGHGRPIIAGKDPISFLHTQSSKERERLQKEFDSGAFDGKAKEYQRMLKLGAHTRIQQKWRVQYEDWFREYEELVLSYQAGNHDEAALKYKEWDMRVRNISRDRILEMALMRDNLRAFQKKAMHWDRRPFEPLRIHPQEFFPNVECSLLDIQPKSPHPLLLELGPGSTRSGDYFEVILRTLSHNTWGGMSEALQSIYPGASEGVISHCPSLRDPAQGGSPFTGMAEASLRTLNESQLMEILQAFMNWPFRPPFSTMVGRMVDETGTTAEDDSKLLGGII